MQHYADYDGARKIHFDLYFSTPTRLCRQKPEKTLLVVEEFYVRDFYAERRMEAKKDQTGIFRAREESALN